MINIFRKLQSLPSSRTVKVLSSWGSKDLKTPYQISQDNYQICSRHLWNVTDIYQIFPIAHLRPRLVSLKMTCFPGVKFVLGKLVLENVWLCTLCILYFHICILWYLSTSPDTHCSILFLSFEQKIWLFIFCSSPIGTFIKAINSNSTSFVVSTFP